MAAKHRAFIGLGANLGNPQSQIQAALNALRTTSGMVLSRASSLYLTAPVDAADQPEYVNAVAMVDTSLSAPALLRALQAIETRFGRERPFPNAPRTLDLDLLLYDDDRIDLSELKIPHPRMHLRRFVLEPLVEIAPEITIPGLGDAAGFLGKSANQQVRRVELT